MLSVFLSKQLYIFGVSYFLSYNAFDGCNYSYQQSDLVKLDILLNGQPVDAMSTIVHNSKSYRVGRELVDKLKKVIDRSFSARNYFILFPYLLMNLNSSEKSSKFLSGKCSRYPYKLLLGQKL
jgi:hypothetical protein